MRRERTLLRGAIVCAATLAAAFGAWNSASAQPTIRFEPDPFAVSTLYNPDFPDRLRIILDNVPATGLKGFRISFRRVSPLLTYYLGSHRVDPDLLAAWGGEGNLIINSVTNNALMGTTTWEARSWTLSGGPSGTVVLGTLGFGAHPSYNGLSGELVWNQDLYDTNIATQSPFNVEAVQAFHDTVFNIGIPMCDAEVVSCAQTSPIDPNLFVDGDTISLDCEIRSNGPNAVPPMPVLAVISSDAMVDQSGDLGIDSAQTPPTIPPGGSATLTLTGTPAYSGTGDRYVCVKVDYLDWYYETSETNNTFCKRVKVLEPFRNLQVSQVGAAPDPVVDPNAIHAGGLLEVTYTIKNAGNAVIRQHTNFVRLSTDPNVDATDRLLCQKGEPESPGIPGGASRTVTYGTDPLATPGTGQKCKIPLTVNPGTYYVGVEGDALAEVFERDPNTGLFHDDDNTNSVQVEISTPMPSRLLAADPKVIGDTNAEITGPGKGPAGFVIMAARDLGNYQFTVEWADPNLIGIEDPANDIIFTDLLTRGGRTQTCSYSNLDNTLGRVTLTCTTNGTGPGVDVESSGALASINFKGLRPGAGTISITGASASTSQGVPIPLTAFNGTFTVTGAFAMEVRNVAAPPGGAFPGSPFTVEYDLCNVGFGESPSRVRTEVILSRDANVDPNGGDPALCAYTELAPVAAFDCVPRSLDFCEAGPDLRPGNYTLYVGPDPDGAVVQTLPLPPRVLALRKKGDRVLLESSAAPDGLGGSAGPVLGRDGKFAAKSIAALKSTARNLNYVAAYAERDRGHEVRLAGTPSYPNQQLDHPPMSRLRLHRENVAVLAGADIDGDGEDELALLSRKKEGDYLEFRHVEYKQFPPSVGVKAAVTGFFAEKIVSAAGIQFDGDPEDEVAVVTEGPGGVQKLSIFDLDVAAPPALSGLTLLAEDPSFGTSADRVESICVMDHGLEGTEEVVTLNRDGTGAQSLKVFQAPATAAGEAVLIADDPAFGAAPGRPRALSISCTR